MPALSSFQQTLLEAAAGTEAGVPADTTDRRSAESLIKRGYLISIPRTGQTSLLAITQKGRAVAGVTEAPVIPAVVAHAEAAPAPAPAPAPAAASKTATLRMLLQRPMGATVPQMTEATGWLPHSVRGFIAGTVKKKLGLTVTSEKTQTGRTYRIVEPAA